LGSVGTVTERNLEFLHDTRERVVELIFTDKDAIVVSIEMSSTYGEMFFSVLEFDEETDFFKSMTIGSIDEEPFSGIIVIINIVFDIFL